MPGWLIGLLVIAGLAAVAVHFSQLERFLEIARTARPAWLLASLALQLATYCALTWGWRSILLRAGVMVPFSRLFPLALSKLFADQAIPSAGLGGNVVLVDRLVALGVPRQLAVTVLLLSVIGYYAAYGVLALATLAALWLNSEASIYFVVPVTLLLVIAIAIPCLALWLRWRGSKATHGALARIRPLQSIIGALGEARPDLLRDRHLLVRVALANAAVFVCDAMTLTFCLAATGYGLHPERAFIAFMMASIAATLSLIPMGLGTFEATSVAVLSMLGIRVEAALTATLLLRGLTTWLPMIPGFLQFRKGNKVNRGTKNVG
jgi:uncharacterized protein (TIRG00374 family)